MRLTYLVIAAIFLEVCHSNDDGNEADGDTSRKILGSSVVTSVSVVMDTGNKKHAVYTDAVGKPQSKPTNPSELASPIDLLNPDRYEFYTFDDNGDLVKRLMSLEEIKSIIATGDSDALDLDSFTAQGFLPEKRVSDVVNNVQTVLKEEMEILKDPISKPIFDTPDVSDSWSMILPAVFGNSGEDIKPEKPAGYVTPDTIMLEPNSQVIHATPGPQNVDILLSSIATTRRPAISTSTKGPTTPSTISSTYMSQPVYYSSQAVLTTKSLPSATEPSLNVEIISNSISTTDNHPSKETNTGVKPHQEDQTLPTRVPVKHSTTPSLVRDVTKTTDTSPALTQITSTASFSRINSTTAKPQSVPVEPTNINNTIQEVQTQSTSIKPTITNWTISGFISTSTQLSDTSYEVPIGLSSTLKPVMSSIPNIFGLPALSQLSSTSHKPSSKLNPTKSPVPNIFGFPIIMEKKNNPTTTLKTPSTSSLHSKSTTTIGTTSQVSIMPQFSTTNTRENLNSSSSITKPTTSEINSYKTTTEANNETGYTDASTQPYIRDNLTSTESYVQPSTWTPSTEDTQRFNIFKEVLSQVTPTESHNNISIQSGTTTEDLMDGTSTTDALNLSSNKIQTTNTYEDLNTLPTENLHQNIPTTTDFDDEDATKLPPLLSSLNDKQKLSASELLDQLLLTTNIYEINTELASSKPNGSDLDLRFDNTNNNSAASSIQDSQQQMMTTDHDIISYPPTTDVTLIESLEQLLSQAVGGVQTIFNETEDIPQTSSSNVIITLNKGTESRLPGFTTSGTKPELAITTINSPMDDSMTTTGNDNLVDSVATLLSQMSDNTPSVNTLVFTEKPNVGVTYRRVEENEVTLPPITAPGNSTATPVASSTNNIIKEPHRNATENIKIKDNEAEQESTTFYYVVKKEPKITTTEETTSHLINITILSFDPTKVRTKPAKADLSLEQELIAEEMKNASQTQNLTVNSTVDQKELLNESENKITPVISTSTDNDQINDNTEKIDTISEPTTSEITLGHDITTSSEEETTEQYVFSTSAIEKTTNDVRFADGVTTELALTETVPTEIPNQSSTSQYFQTTRTVSKPSIVITINENNTIVTENGELVANKTISNSFDGPQEVLNATSTPSALKVQKNSTQDQTWTLVSTLAPQHVSNHNIPPPTIPYPEVLDTPVPVDLVPKPMQGFGLEESTSTLDIDVHQFAQLCNELAFGFWKTVTTGLSSARSIFVSPFAATSMLAMVFLGAKGATSEEMNEILKLDDMVTFNPHLTFKSVSESVTSEPNSGVATTAMIRELFSDRSKGKLLDFYKNRVRAFYDGFVEEVSYREIGDVIRRRSNLLVKKHTNGKYAQFLNGASIIARPPLSGISINIFETDCSQTSTEGRDGELHFIVFPSIKQRRLVPVPAVVYRSGFLAGYEPSLDATAVALGGKDQVVSTILVIPGQQGIAAPGDGLARLEKRLVESSFKKGAWSRLLRSLISRPGLELQIPRFSHRSVINATNTLKKMGLHELFNPDSADLRGLSGIANELHLSDVLQINKFSTCGERRKDETHHSEVYPATTMRARSARRLHHWAPLDQDEPRDYQRAFPDPLHDPSLLELPLSIRPRQARIPDVPRLRFDRPFLYFVRHNPTGLILHMGRFNPRLLP